MVSPSAHGVKENLPTTAVSNCDCDLLVVASCCGDCKLSDRREREFAAAAASAGGVSIGGDNDGDRRPVLAPSREVQPLWNIKPWTGAKGATGCSKNIGGPAEVLPG